MVVSILATKLFVPPARENAIARPDLIEKLFSGVSRPGCFTIVSGPAGFGKTTLLSDFISQLQQPAAWVSLDEGDNDPARFWSYLFAACQPVLDGVARSLPELDGATEMLPEDTIPTVLINDLASCAQEIVLILEDFHEIHHSTIHAGMLFLLEHLPHNLRLILSSRADPPWPLARFRARNQLVEIRTGDLRFRHEEALQFLNHTMGLELSGDEIAALEERTEGWAAGLQLAALSMQGRSDIPAFIQTFTGSQLYVADYLMEEVLQHQPEDVRSFLLRTSILKRMNAALCDAVTGCRDGQTMLRALHQANVFLIPLDGEGHWFRYHHLFADLLQARLRQKQALEMIGELHRRASGWYERNGFYQEAIQHALAARDFERAASLVEDAAQPLIFAGRLGLLRTWLDAIPEAMFQAHPKLTFYRFWIDALQSKADLSDQSLKEMGAMLKALPASPENDSLRGELMSVVSRAVALSGRTTEGIRLAQEALAYLPPENLTSRARANSALAAAYGLSDRGNEAGLVYLESIRQSVETGDYRLAASTMMVQGLIQFQSGHLHAAAQTFQAIIDLGSLPDIDNRYKDFFPAGQGYIGLGMVYLEWNDLEKAEDNLKKGLDLCRRGGLDGIFIGRMQMSRLRQALGDLEGALEEIRHPEQSGQRVDEFNIATRNIQIALAMGDFEEARRWAAPLVGMLDSPPDAPRPPGIFMEIVEASVARVYMAQGNTRGALGLLDRLQAAAEPVQRISRVIEVYLLRSLALLRGNRDMPSPEAIRNIEQALVLAEPYGYMLLFLEEGAALVPLLRAVLDRGDAPVEIRVYARRLLEASGEPLDQLLAGEAAGLVEPLTPREMEVLVLLAAGDSNQDIAEKLVITVRTVKKHTGNIYGKLGAGSRIQAVARARALGLLDMV